MKFLGEDQQINPIHSKILTVYFLEILDSIFAIFGQNFF